MNESTENRSLADITRSFAQALEELGIPVELTKATTQTVAQLIFAGGRVATAKMDAYAAELNARGEARAHLTVASAELIAGMLGSDEPLAQRAALHYADKIIGEQENVEAITKLALEDLRKAERPEKETEALSDDWINNFRNEAAKKSEEYMRAAFAKVLSGEIQKPGSYSLKSVRILAELDGHTASIFITLCSMALCVPRVNDARVIAVAGIPGKNGLAKFGLSFGQLNILEEFGLIISDYNSHMPYTQFANADSIEPMRYAGKDVTLRMAQENSGNGGLQGVALSRVGYELMNVINITENAQYTIALTEHLRANKFRLVTLQ